jgi:secreted Zn-dependent insulinase-like peptidase
MVAVQTIMSFHAVEVSFPLPYQPARWKYKPGNFLAHFVGHEGPGSLHSYLKQKGWLTGLSSGPQNLAREFAMFKITLQLTREGFCESLIMSPLGEIWSNLSPQRTTVILSSPFTSTCRFSDPQNFLLGIRRNSASLMRQDSDSLRNSVRMTMQFGCQNTWRGLLNATLC